MNSFFCTLVLICIGLTQSLAQTELKNQTKSVLDSPVEFSGGITDTSLITSITEVRIGLFLPQESESKTAEDLNRAVNLAIEEINSKGGYRGIPFKAINRWSANPWRSGSKEMIKMVYQDSVWAVIGSLDGEATHVAEQIVTKAWVPLLSPISADPTLTYIRIPWIFRLPPDFKSQSEILLKESKNYHQMKNIGLITENNHDGRTFSEDMLESMSQFEISPKFHFQISSSDQDLHAIVERALSFDPNSIILCISAENIIKLLAGIGKYSNSINILIPWIPGLNYKDLRQFYSGDIYCIEPFNRLSNTNYEKFARKYKKLYGVNPTFGAAYTYDAVHILARAIKKSGLNRTHLRKAIFELQDFKGVTGHINWDNGGGNLAQPVLRVISN
jgi:branched-chain amino acid transport system substrate-binding protein